MSSDPGCNRESVRPRYLRRWGLTSDGAAIRGNNAVVHPVRTADGQAAVLRIGGSGGDDAAAFIALRCWDGDGAVRLLRHDVADNVSLLERLDHTRDLESLPVGEAIEIAAALRARLIRPAPPGLPTVAQLSAGWPELLRHTDALTPAVARQAAALCTDLRASTSAEHLVNADLHDANVLAGVREPWLVVDPFPVAGDREFGIMSLLWGRWPDADPVRLLRTIVDVGDLDGDRARAWAVVEIAVKLITRTSPRDAACRAVLARLLH